MVNLVENLQLVEAINPKTTNGALTGDYISLKNAKRAWIVLNFTQAAGHATAITVEQATNVAAGGTKAIATVVPIWANEDTAATDTLVRQTDAVAFTVANNIKNKQVVFQIDPSTLDIAGGFDCITVKTAASSETTNFVSAIYIIDTKYAKATPESAIID